MPKFWPRRLCSEISTPTEVNGLVTVARSKGSRKLSQQDPLRQREADPLGLDISLETFEQHAGLLSDRNPSRPAGDLQNAIYVRRLQRDYGTRYVQMLLEYNRRHKASGLQTAYTGGPTMDSDGRKIVEGKASTAVDPQTDSNGYTRAGAQMDKVEHVRRPG